ncbi:MAG TPA: alpha/beta fold hydrolase [Terriglobales bacterium]|nr:alpha/beta fold hydrolase [Terriglobales bacterium]
MVLVHGLAVSSRYMVPLARALSPYWNVYAPDLPGYGRSETPDHPLPITSLAGILRSWTRNMHLRETILVGNSMGCQIIVEYLLQNSNEVQACVMLGPTMDVYARSTLAQVWRLFLDQFYEPPSLVPMQAFEYLRFGPIRTAVTFLNALDHDMHGKLAAIRIPTLVMRGSKDPIVSQRWVNTLSRTLPQARLLNVPGAGHALNYNSPSVVADELRRFYFSIQRRAA